LLVLLPFLLLRRRRRLSKIERVILSNINDDGVRGRGDDDDDDDQIRMFNPLSSSLSATKQENDEIRQLSCYHFRTNERRQWLFNGVR
jgi:hypothetical protein